MTLRQQIVDDHIEKLSKRLGVTKDKAFQLFSHSLFTDKSVYSFDPYDDVDGGQDKQLDCITIEENSDEAIIYISQSKNEGSFSSNCVIQIRNGLQWIFEKSKSDVSTIANKNLKDKILSYREIQNTTGPSNIHVKVGYITNGLTNELSNETKQEVKTILDSYNNGSFASFSFETIGADTLVDIINSQEKKNKKINCDIKILYDTNNPSLLKYHSKGLKGIICTAKASEIARVVLEDKNGFVFDLNIRKYLGKLGGVNKDIIGTCSNIDTSHLFWFLNNGLTIVCDKVDPVTDPDDPKVKIDNMQIVNGCQTATSLANAFQEGKLEADTRVMLRIYETNDLELVDRIVLTTNNQNKISGRNLRANERKQLDLEQGFKKFDYYLERKSRQYENVEVPKEKIIPNEDVAVSYLAVVLKKPSDSRSRKYKVWNELYGKIFSDRGVIEQYILSVLIHRKVNKVLRDEFSDSENELTRYLAKNASFHISRIFSFLWRGNDNWSEISEMTNQINSIKEDSDKINNLVKDSVGLISKVIKDNYVSFDYNTILKSADLDSALTRELHISQKKSSKTQSKG